MAKSVKANKWKGLPTFLFGTLHFPGRLFQPRVSLSFLAFSRLYIFTSDRLSTFRVMSRFLSLSRRCCCVRMRKWGYEVVTSRRFALPRPYMDSLWSPPAKRRNFCVCGWAHLAGRIRELKVVSDVGINWGRKDGGAWKKKKSEGTSGGSELGRPFHLIHASTFVMSNGVTILRNLLFLTGRSALLEDVSLSLSYF